MESGEGDSVYWCGIVITSKERRMATPSLVDLNERLPHGNVWQNRGRPKSLIPRVAVPTWDTPSYSREWDLTFSLGRETTEYEVLRLLLNSGCIDDTNIHDMIRGIVVGDNFSNGQVFVYCAKPHLSNIFVRKLKDFLGVAIQNCHTYSNEEIPVKFSFIHPSVDIQKDIVDRHLKKYGEVKSWSYVTDRRYNVRTCAVIFLMKERDLNENPLPSKIFINGRICRISYKNQPKTCFTCGSTEHMKKDCTHRTDQICTS